MKRTTATETITTASGHPGWKRKLIRTTALTAAIVIGVASATFAIFPTARAFAATAGTSGHESFFASMHGGHSHEDTHAHFDKVLTEAGASDAQRKQIHAMMKDAMTAERADMDKFHDSLKQLKALLTAETIDDAAIANVRAEQDRLMLATSHRLSDAMIAAARILTPAQRAKLGADIDRMMASHDMRHHGG